MITIREEILAEQPIHQIWHNLLELSWAGNKKNQIFEGINLSRSWNVNIFERCKHFSDTNWREFLKKAQKERGFLSEFEKKMEVSGIRNSQRINWRSNITTQFLRYLLQFIDSVKTISQSSTSQSLSAIARQFNPNHQIILLNSLTALPKF